MSSTDRPLPTFYSKERLAFLERYEVCLGKTDGVEAKVRRTEILAMIKTVKEEIIVEKAILNCLAILDKRRRLVDERAESMYPEQNQLGTARTITPSPAEESLATFEYAFNPLLQQQFTPELWLGFFRLRTAWQGQRSIHEAMAARWNYDWATEWNMLYAKAHADARAEIEKTDVDVVQMHLDALAKATSRLSYAQKILVDRPKADPETFKPASPALLGYLKGAGGSEHSFHSLLALLQKYDACLRETSGPLAQERRVEIQDMIEIVKKEALAEFNMSIELAICTEEARLMQAKSQLLFPELIPLTERKLGDLTAEGRAKGVAEYKKSAALQRAFTLAEFLQGFRLERIWQSEQPLHTRMAAHHTKDLALLTDQMFADARATARGNIETQVGWMEASEE